MTSPLRTALLGGAIAVSLSIGAAMAAQTTTTTTTSMDGGKVERQVTIVHRGDSPDGDHWDKGHGWGGQRGGDHAWGGQGRGEHAAEHLRTLLQLTPAQEPALKTFLASMTPLHAHDGKPGGAPHPPGPPPADPAARKADMEKRMAEMHKRREAEVAMTTPQRLDALVKHTADRQAELQVKVNAVKTFYAALTPSQQKVFDTLHGAMIERGAMHHGGPGEHGMEHDRRMAMGPPPPMPPAPPGGR